MQIAGYEDMETGRFYKRMRPGCYTLTYEFEVLELRREVEHLKDLAVREKARVTFEFTAELRQMLRDVAAGKPMPEMAQRLLDAEAAPWRWYERPEVPKR